MEGVALNADSACANLADAQAASRRTKSTDTQRPGFRPARDHNLLVGKRLIQAAYTPKTDPRGGCSERTTGRESHKITSIDSDAHRLPPVYCCENCCRPRYSIKSTISPGRKRGHGICRCCMASCIRGPWFHKAAASLIDEVAPRQ